MNYCARLTDVMEELAKHGTEATPDRLQAAADQLAGIEEACNGLCSLARLEGGETGRDDVVPDPA